MSRIRNSAKAIIIKNNKLLCTKNKDQFGVFYLLPGGGQKSFETIEEALLRECKEEISADIIIGDLVFVREYIGKNHEFAEWDSDVHQIEYMFECKLKSDTDIKTGSTPDIYQIGVKWLDLNNLGGYRIYPSILKDIIKCDGTLSGRVYLGDVN
ncbi:NUDIX domain-containing protein [Halothermothrix orenii]|nr:NUDIX domain-containing protein [Halothermothrix orenii]